MKTILSTESDKRTKRLHIIYWLIIVNIAIYSFFAYSYNKAYQSIVEQETKLISKIKIHTALAQTSEEEPSGDKIIVPYVPITIKEKIEMAALESNISVDEALGVANCESRLNPRTKSRISTAKGVFQFLDGTWANYCDGDVLNENDNIKCFMNLYNKHKAWWECAKILGYTR